MANCGIIEEDSERHQEPHQPGKDTFFFPLMEAQGNVYNYWKLRLARVSVSCDSHN